MAITVQEFAKAIRLSVDDPTGTALADATRLLAFCNAAIERYAGAEVPEAISDMAVVQLGQYLYDAPVAERSRPQSALANSGVRAMLAPYRVHRAGVMRAEEAASGVMGIAGINLRYNGVDLEGGPFTGINLATNDLDSVRLVPGVGMNPGFARLIINPEIAVENMDGSIRLGNTRTIRFAGDGVTLMRPPGSTVMMVTIPGGGLTDSQIRALFDGLSKITALEAFESVLRYDDTVVERHPVDIVVTGTATRLAGNPEWPSARSDRMITISFYPYPSGTTATHTFPLSEVLAKTSASGTLDASNSVTFQPSDMSVTYFVGRIGNQIAISADSIGAYYVTIHDSEVDLSSWARASNTDPIPAEKLTNAPSGGGGLSQAQVDARVQAGVLDWAEAGNTDPIPADKLTNAPSSGGGLNQAAVDARIQTVVPDWALNATRFSDEQQAVFDAFEGDDVWIDSPDVTVSQASFASVPTVSQASAATYGATFRSGPALDNRYLIVRVPVAKSADRQRGLMRVAREPTEPPNVSLSVSNTWTELSVTDSVYDYFYSTQIDVPAAEAIRVEEYDELRVNPDRLENYFIPETWARQGNTDPIPASKVSVLQQYVTERYDAVAGLAIADVTNNRRGLLTLFTDPLTLTASDHGLLLVGIQWNVAVGSTSQLAIDDDVTDERNIAFHEITASTDYSASGDAQGVKVGEVDVWNVTSGNRGTTQYGTVSFYIAKNAAGNVGFYFDYDAEVGGVSSAGSIQATIEIYSLPSGAPSASGGVNRRSEVLLDFTWPSRNSVFALNATQRTTLVTALTDSTVTYLTYELTESNGDEFVSIIPISEAVRAGTKTKFEAPMLIDSAGLGSLTIDVQETTPILERRNYLHRPYEFADASKIRAIRL